jgi:hypothetical protein
VYNIGRRNDVFDGEAQFQVWLNGGNNSPKLQTTANVNIPNDVLRSFLQILATTQISPGPYEPAIDHTDDYPYIFISLNFGGKDMIDFGTSSQGNQHVPWRLTYNGIPYVVNLGIPNQAYAVLGPYLALDARQSLIQELISKENQP